MVLQWMLAGRSVKLMRVSIVGIHDLCDWNDCCYLKGRRFDGWILGCWRVRWPMWVWPRLRRRFLRLRMLLGRERVVLSGGGLAGLLGFSGDGVFCGARVGEARGSWDDYVRHCGFSFGEER